MNEDKFNYSILIISYLNIIMIITKRTHPTSEKKYMKIDIISLIIIIYLLTQTYYLNNKQ
jgi:hypothetical protein